MANDHLLGIAAGDESLDRLRPVVEEAAADAGQESRRVRLAVRNQNVWGGGASLEVGHVPYGSGSWPATVGIQPGPRLERPVGALALAVQDRHVIGTLIGHHQVGRRVDQALLGWVGRVRNQVVIEVGNRHAGRVLPGREALRASELSVAQPEVDEHVVAAAVGHNQIGNAVTIQIGHLDRAGSKQAVRAILLEALAR